jgi:uncharacterized protein (TIGR02268 family)
LGIAALLLVSADAAGASAAPARELRHRTLTIGDRDVDTLPEVHVSGGATTLFTFPAPISDGGAVLADPRGLFYPPTQTDRTVIVAPKADLVAPAALHVSLVDGTVVTFKLASVPSDSDAQIDVVLALRIRASADSGPALRRALEVCHAEVDECRAGAAHAGVRGLAALLFTEAADASQAFDRHPLHGGDRQNGLLVQGSFSYRLMGFTFLVFRLENRDPGQAWTFERAEVRLEGKGEVADVKVLAEAAEVQTLAPSEAGRVVVAFKSISRALGQKFTVTFREKDGGRHAVLDGLSP